MAGELSVKRALGGGVLVLVATLLGRMLAMGALSAALGIDPESADPAARRDGLLLGGGILGGCALGGLALFLVARPAPASALALARPSFRALVGWTAASLALGAGTRALGAALGQPLIEPAWIDAYRTAPAALLALALATTSIFEELYFRGLLQTALARTRLGVAGGIAIPALLFVAAHQPTDPFRALDVLASALLLALARHTSGSSLAAVPGHVLGNLALLALIAARAG